MSVLSKNFDYKSNQCSPTRVDYFPYKEVDEKGKEYTSYKEVDYSEVVKSHGTMEMWSLEALVKAGIDPNFGIRTGFATGLEAESAIQSAIGVIDSAIAESSN